MNDDSQNTVPTRDQRRFLEHVQGVFDSAALKLDPTDLRVYGKDWTQSYEVSPLAVVLPTSIEQIVELVRIAIEHGYQLVPSGGRTGLSGGCVATSNEVVVSFDRMNQILDFNQTDRIVRCQAGVTTAELQQFAAEQGLFYPVDFSSSGSSQIGGNVATNAGGIRVIRYGLTRDWVVGLTVVTGTGSVMRLNRGLVKNATGYDFRHLFIGSEGTLGFIIEADMLLRVPPKPQRVMVLCMSRMANMLSILRRFQEAVDLSAFEFFSELALSKVIEHSDLQRPSSKPFDYYVLLEYDEEQDDQAVTAFEECLQNGWVGDAVTSQSEAQFHALWDLRDRISESISGFSPYKNDISVRISQIPEFLNDVESIVEEHYPDFEVCWFGHIGDGNLHLNILKPDSMDPNEFHEHCCKINPLLFELIQRRGGSISAEHGVGLLKRSFLSYSRTETEIETMRSVKRAFDPNGILNPGKLL